jgi:hypothetical protein
MIVRRTKACWVQANLKVVHPIATLYIPSSLPGNPEAVLSKYIVINVTITESHFRVSLLDGRSFGESNS